MTFKNCLNCIRENSTYIEVKWIFTYPKLIILTGGCCDKFSIFVRCFFLLHGDLPKYLNNKSKVVRYCGINGDVKNGSKDSIIICFEPNKFSIVEV